jgi:hypothetical protein
MRKTVSEVYLVFTVTEQHGHYIENLKKNDFKILDDGKPPAEIVSFSCETDLPLQVGVLIDASQLVTSRFKFEQEAAIEFLKHTIRPKYDQALVIGFDLTAKSRRTSPTTPRSFRPVFVCFGRVVSRPYGAHIVRDTIFRQQLRHWAAKRTQELQQVTFLVVEV